MSQHILSKILEDLDFDKTDFDSVWKNQPRLLMNYGYKLAEAERTMARAKSRMDVTEAKAYRQYRSSMGFDGARVSESAIDSRVKSDAEYITARTEYDDAKYLCDIYKQAVAAFSHRRDMIVQASKAAIIEMKRLGAERFSSPR